MESPSQPDNESVRRLVDNHRQFRAFLAGKVVNPTDAEEILQAAYLRGVEKAESIRDGESVIAWFYRLLRNAIIDHYRHRDVERRAIERAAGWALDQHSPPPELQDAICKCIYSLLPTMHTDYAEIIQVIDLEGGSIAELAEELGMTPNNARVKLHRARKALRKQLEISCGSCTEHGCLDCDCRQV
jgi:RNA polymerase sigma factor (sigma-70 family)